MEEGKKPDAHSQMDREYERYAQEFADAEWQIPTKLKVEVKDIFKWAAVAPTSETETGMLNFYKAELTTERVKELHSMGVLNDSSKKYINDNLLAEKYLHYRTELPTEKMQASFVVDGKVLLCISRAPLTLTLNFN